MDTQTAIHILTEHNKWRRGEIEEWVQSGEDGYTCKKLGQAIDHAITIMMME